jgi:hypothetical protein
MASSLPIVRQIAWLSLLPQIAILLLIIAIVHLLGGQEPLLVGAVAYLVVSFILRLTIARHHVRGMGLIRRERFTDAIPHFFNSYEFFTKYAWVDRWRAVTMLSSSRISYKEMGLLNAAFCLAQTGERERSIQEYKRVLAEFPGSKMAETALRLMESQASSA